MLRSVLVFLGPVPIPRVKNLFRAPTRLPMHYDLSPGKTSNVYLRCGLALTPLNLHAWLLGTKHRGFWLDQFLQRHKGYDRCTDPTIGTGVHHGLRDARLLDFVLHRVQ